MLSRPEAVQRAREAEQAANEQGLIRTTYMYKAQDHFNRLIRIVNSKYHTEYPTFKAHTVMIDNAEAILGEGYRDSYCRASPFIPEWMLTIIRVEREWRRNPHKTEEAHEAIIDAFAAGLRGDLDTLESFFGLYDLNKEYEKELFGTAQPTQSPIADLYGFMTVNEVREEQGLDPL